MAGTKAGSSISVEILKEIEVITPVRVIAKFLARSVNRAPSLIIRQKEGRETMRDVVTLTGKPHGFVTAVQVYL